MNIVYLVFGTKIENYQQAYFSIFTAQLHKNDDDKIIVITDDSSLFGFFEDKIETMWNAGLIGVSQKHFECLELTLQINDAMCADGVTRRLIEQFAFSLGLNQYSELQPADHIVGHYWGNKKQWNDTISLFLRECFMKKYHFDAVVERIKDMELSKIPIRIKESSTQRKLKNLIDKFYTNQRPVYVKK